MNNFTKAFYTTKSKLTSLVLLTFFALMLLGSEQGFAQQTAVYTVTSTTTATQSGTKPTGASHSYSQTFGTVSQMTNGNSSTLTLTGYAGYRITSIVLNMRSNASGGAGSMNVVAGSTNIFSIPTAGFNNAAWNGAYSTTYVNLSAKTPTAYNITTGQNVVITILASANSLYIGSYSITYVPSGPSLTTPTVGSINNDGATLGATVSSDGGASLTSRGTVWGTATAPTGNVLAEGGTAVSAFTHARTGMGPNVLIYYRGYAINANGTGYSPESTFYTLANQASAPTVSNPTDTTLDVAITSGDGNPAITTYAIQDVASGNYVPLAGGALSATPVYQTAAAWGTKTVTGLSNGTTYNFRAIARNGDLTLSTASSNGSGTTTTPSGTITTTPASYGPFCNNSSNGISVAYSTTGTLTGTFYAQISDASGNFTNGVYSGATIIGSGASPISATIPSGLAAGTGYRVRVINDTPATYGTDNGTAFTISAPPVITSGTLADASTNVGVATTFGVTATNAVSYQWYVDTGSGFSGPIVDGTSGGVTYSNATTNILSVNPSSTAANGYKYKVTVNGNSPCGSVDSTPSGGATLTVTLAPVALATYAFEGVATATVPANVTAAAVSSVGASAISYQGGTDGGGTQIGFNTTWPASATFNASTAQYLQFDLQANSTYELTLSSASINLGRTATGPSNVTVQYSLDGFVTAGTTCLNNVTVSSTSTSALNTFALTSLPSGAFSSKITFRIWAYNSGGGNLRFNNFVINGNVALTVGSNLAAYASQPSSDIASGSTNVPLAGFSVTPTTSADFTSVTVTGVSSSPSDITNVRIFRDNNGNGIIDGADASVSGAGIAFANGNLSAMTISGETGFSGARNYLIVADISASPSSTSVGVSIGSGNFVTSLASNTGSMAVNTRTLIVPTSTLAAYGTFTGNITKGTTDALLAGFSVTPSESANFTSVTLTGVSTAPGDITSVRIFRDNNGNGLIDGADASVSGAGVAFANGNLSAISISGETGFSSIRYYIVVANVSGTATSSSVGVSIGSGNFATTLVEAGSMATNTRTLVNSALSNIIRSTGFTEPTNLAYGTYQTNNITAAGAGVGNIKIAEFTIQDGGGSNDGDGLGTILNSLTFTVSNFANVRRLALVDGATVVSDVAVSSSSATFSSLTLTAADNGSKTFSVYASFNTAVTDNQNIGLTVSAATPSPSGSGFAVGNAGAAASVVTGNTNKIVVTATKLLFGTVSGSTFNVNLPAFTVSTTDANNNRDTDINALSVTLGTDGTGATLSNPHTITAGTVSISTVQFNTPQVGIKLTASASGYSTVDSNTFTISSFAEGTWRTLSDGAWHSTANHVNATATFERIVSGVWVPQGNYGTSPFAPIQAPTSGSANQVIIAHNITLIGTNTHKNIVIASGGTLNTSTVAATFGSLLVETGGVFNREGSVTFDTSGTLEVQDGATFRFKQTNQNSRTNGIWAGTEKFHKDSTFEIYYSDSSLLSIIEAANDVSLFTDGTSTACFGNIIINVGTGNMNLIPTGFGTVSPAAPKQLTHQDLILRTNSNTSALCAGIFNVIIGRDLIIESTYNNNATLMNTASTAILNVKGSIIHSAPRTFTLANNASANLTVNVDGDVTVNPASAGTLNINGNTTGVVALNIKGDLTVNTNGTISAVGTTTGNNVITFNGTGDGSTAALTQSVSVASTAATENNNIAYVVENGSYTQLAADLELGNGGTFTVKTGGTLDFGFSGATTTAFNLTERPGGPTGTTVFTSQTGTTLRITSAGGIMAAPAASGNVLLDSRSYAQNGCTFNYVGRANQVTGDIFTSGSTSKTIICDLDTSALTLTLSVPTQTSTLLNIKKGIFVESNTNYLSGGGALTIDATGTYRSAIENATGNFPLLTGTRTFAAGSTLELNAGAGTEQTLRGGLQYKNLIFSNGGTKKLSSSTAEIDGTVTIKDAAIVDAENNTFGDYATTILAMTDTSRLILSKAATVPDMGRYNLTGGTIEFAGNSNLHRMRGPIYGSLSPDVDTVYNNVVISGANVNGGSGNYTFRNGASFTVNSGARFSVTNQELQADTAAAVAVNINGTFATADIHGFSGDNDSSINPTGMTITLGATSTVEYNGTAAQVLSSRSDYKNLTIDNSLNTGTRGVTANGDVTFSGDLALTDGLVNTGSFAIIGTATSTATVGTGWVNGNFRKFIASGSTSRDFEIGSSTVYAPVSLAFTGTISASTGSITATTTNGDHPQIATSGFNTSKTVNRYYTLTNDTAVPGLTSYSPTFTYVAGDNDVAATPADYLIRRYSGTWSTSSISGTPTNTSATTTGVTGFGDFAIGENKITPTVVVNLAPSYTYISDPQGPNSLSSPSSPVPTDVTYSYEGTGATVYGPSATRPENAGTYQVTATLNEDANYYAAAPVTENFTILQKELTLIDLGTNDKVYDATTAASFTIVPAGPGVPGTRLAGIIPGDTVGYTPAGYFFDGAAPVSNVGTWTIISTTTLNGAESANYFLTQPIFGAQKDITPLGLTVSGFTASNKPYDGNRDATVSVAGVSLVGVLGGQSVTLDSGSVTGLFDTKDIGTGKTVTASGFFITGPDASNYALTQPTTTANITTVPLTITAEDISSCAGTFVTTGRTEFTRSVNIPGDITSVTLTPSPGDGSTPGDYTLTPSAAAGPGVGNYGPITYVAGTLHVNRTPTATIGGTATICLNEAQPSITFTGANGEGTVHYRFYYRLNGGAELFRDSDPGVSTASFLVSTTTTRTDTYTLTRVLDLNTGCEQAQTGSAVMTIGLCTQVRPLQCGLTLPALNTPIQASALPGATQYRFEVTRIDTNTVYPLITVPTYLFNPSTQIPGGFLYGKSYSIRVQVFIGSWLAYGNACTVTAPSTPPVAPTKIRSFQCGATLLTVDTSIEAVPVYLATQYQFEVTPQGGSAVVVTTPNYYFTLTGTASLAAYSKAYSIRVNTLSGGNWTGFGDTCIVTTPARPTTKLVTAQCGATFNNLTFTLNSSNVPLVTKYRFRVVNGETTRIAEVSRNYIIPSDLAGGYANNTVYTVDVATLYNGLWSGYGPACTVTTPFIRMAAQDINTNVFEVKAFPNPFARHFSLDIQSSSDDLVQVRVYDMIGRELEVQNATVSELSTKEIGTNYPSGVYNVVVSQGDKVRSVRMIKR